MCPVDFGKQLHLKHMFYETNMWRNLGPSQVNSNLRSIYWFWFLHYLQVCNGMGILPGPSIPPCPFSKISPDLISPIILPATLTLLFFAFTAPFAVFSLLLFQLCALQITFRVYCSFHLSMMKYILEIKPTGDQDSAASNCFNVGGCMIRVVCFTQNLYSKRKKMELERLTRATKLCWSCLGSTKHETDPHPLVHFDTNY